MSVSICVVHIGKKGLINLLSSTKRLTKQRQNYFIYVLGFDVVVKKGKKWHLGFNYICYEA